MVQMPATAGSIVQYLPERLGGVLSEVRFFEN